MVRCSAWNANGRRCKLHRCGDSDTCYMHGPVAPATASVATTAAAPSNVIVQEQKPQTKTITRHHPYMYSQEELLKQKKRNQEVWERILPSLDSSTLASASSLAAALRRSYCLPPGAPGVYDATDSVNAAMTAVTNALVDDMNQNNYGMSENIWANVQEGQGQSQDQGQEQDQAPTLMVQEQSQEQEQEQGQEQGQEQAEEAVEAVEAVACGHLCHFNNVICCGCNDLRPQGARCHAVIGGIVVPDAGQRREEYCAECRNAYEVMPYERQVCALMTAFPASHRSDVGAAACFTLCTEIQMSIQKLVTANNLLFAHATELQISR